MKCTECNEKVKDNTKYSIHMNRKHRGMSYTPFVPKDTTPIESILEPDKE